MDLRRVVMRVAVTDGGRQPWMGVQVVIIFMCMQMLVALRRMFVVVLMLLAKHQDDGKDEYYRGSRLL